MTLPEHLDSYALLVLLAFLGSTWIGVIIVRFINAPVMAYAQGQKNNAILVASNVALNDRLKPRIRIFLRDTAVIELPTEIMAFGSTGRGPLSKWVQFSVSCATDVPLVECEAFVTSVRQIDERYQVIGAELVEHDVNCTWSQKSDLKISIPFMRIHDATLFSIYETPGANLQPETRPVKISLHDGIQARGRYRIHVLVTAKDAPPKTETFIFEWPDYSNIRLVLQT